MAMQTPGRKMYVPRQDEQRKIDAFATGLSDSVAPVFREVVISWMTNHPGAGLPNLAGMADVAISETARRSKFQDPRALAHQIVDSLAPEQLKNAVDALNLVRAGQIVSPLA